MFIAAYVCLVVEVDDADGGRLPVGMNVVSRGMLETDRVTWIAR
jgi:hypothetical protein